MNQVIEMNPSYTIYPLQGKVQHYEWGGFSYLPSLLGINNEEKRPFAEYWLGVHPLGVATIVKDDEVVALDVLLKGNLNHTFSCYSTSIRVTAVSAQNS